MEFFIRIEGTLKDGAEEAITAAEALKSDAARAASKVVEQLLKAGAELKHASFSSGHVMGGSVNLLVPAPEPAEVAASDSAAGLGAEV